MLLSYLHFHLVKLMHSTSQGKLSFAVATNLQIPKVYCSLSLQSDTGQSALLGGYFLVVVRFELLPDYNFAVSDFLASHHSGRRESMPGAYFPFFLPQTATATHYFPHTHSHEPESVT